VWRTLDGAALYAAKPAAGAIAERTLAEFLADRLGVEAVARPDGNGWEIAGISEELRDQFSSRRRAIAPRVQQLIDEYERKHGKAPNARALWSMAQFVTLDSRRAKAHSAPSRDALLAQWEAQSRRAETEALSAIPDAALGRRGPGAEGGPPSGADVDVIGAGQDQGAGLVDRLDPLRAGGALGDHQRPDRLHRPVPALRGTPGAAGLGGAGSADRIERVRFALTPPVLPVRPAGPPPRARGPR